MNLTAPPSVSSMPLRRLTVCQVCAELTKAVKLLPHQPLNSGGFFVAVIEKFAASSEQAPAIKMRKQPQAWSFVPAAPDCAQGS